MTRGIGMTFECKSCGSIVKIRDVVIENQKNKYSFNPPKGTSCKACGDSEFVLISFREMEIVIYDPEHEAAPVLPKEVFNNCKEYINTQFQSWKEEKFGGNKNEN